MRDNNSNNIVDLQKWTPRIESSVTNIVVVRHARMVWGVLQKIKKPWMELSNDDSIDENSS